jgi:hypothetical protein
MKSLLLKTCFLTAASLALLGAKSATQEQAQRLTGSSSSNKPPCADSIGSCPLKGCGTNFDANLNLVKNITILTGDPTPRSITWMQKLDDPDNFAQGDERTELTNLGEGSNLVVVAYLIAVRKEPGGESCNCGLHDEDETDNHLVLVKKSTVDQMPLSGNTKAKIAATEKQREAESTTAEFTPRVRHPNHPNFTFETMNPLINDTTQKALWVRVSGQLMFDSEHFLRNHLDRVNNWEIHPVFKMEYCTTGSDCTIGNDAGWKSIDDSN